MSDDLLERLLKDSTRALRGAGEPPPADLSRTRMRVMDTVRARQRRRTRVVQVALPIAAVLAGTTAWAAGTGRLDAAVRGVRALFVEEAPTSVPSAPTAGPPTAQRDEPAPRPEPEPILEPPPVVEPSPPMVEAPPVPSAKPRPPASAAPSAPSAQGTAVDDATSADLALYKRAHRLHFVDKSYAAALDAWDEYLRGSPGGAFVIEARYNRAICFLKLGRKAEAKAALEPFAAGSVGGGYRKAEAQKLLDALDSQ